MTEIVCVTGNAEVCRFVMDSKGVENITRVNRSGHYICLEKLYWRWGEADGWGIWVNKRCFQI